MAPTGNPQWNAYRQQPSQYQAPNHQVGYPRNAHQQRSNPSHDGNIHRDGALMANANETRAVETLSAMSAHQTGYPRPHGVGRPNPPPYQHPAWNQDHRQPSANISSIRQSFPPAYGNISPPPNAPQYGHDPGMTAHNRNFESQTAPAQSRVVNDPSSYMPNSQAVHRGQAFQQQRTPVNAAASNGRDSLDATLPPVSNFRRQSATPTSVQQQHRPPPSTNMPSHVHLTVDPTQVYDPYLERQREFEKMAEARRAREAEEAAHKSEQELKQRQAEEAQKMAAAKNAQPTFNPTAPSAQPSTGMEAGIRKLFRQIKHVKEVNPELLARLWAEEFESQNAEAKSAPIVERPTHASKVMDAPAPAAPLPKTLTKGETIPKAAKAERRRPAEPTRVNASPFPKAATAPLAAPSVAGPPHADKSSSAQVASTQNNMWPIERKQMVAEVAAKWINDRTENAGKTISVQAVAKLLDSNPSYPSLCETIESLGFSLHRGQFAQTLLRAIPDLSKPSPVAPVKLIPPPSLTSPSTLPAVKDTSAKGIDPKPPRISTAAEPSPPVVASSPAPQTQVEKQLPPANLAKFMSHKPQTKEQAARKRLFSEIINLADDDSDNDEPPPKIPNTNSLAQYYSLQEEQPASTVEMSLKQKHKPQVDELYGKVLVGPLRRDQVVRRSVYDPKTIARDILLATGRHPEMRPLNGHLMGLQFLLADHSGNEVEGHKYDLTTIRWDLIDPGEPIADNVDAKSDDGALAGDESDGSTMAIRPIRSTAAMPNGDGTMTMVEIPLPPAIQVGLKPTLKAMGRRTRGPKKTASVGTSLASGNSFGNDGSRDGRWAPRGSEAGRHQASSRDQANQHTRQLASVTLSRSGVEPSASAPTVSGAIGYAAFNQGSMQYDEMGRPIKKKGRPFGWRKAIHGKEANGLSPEPSKQRGPKPREPGTSKTHVDKPFTEADHRVWKCRWEGCGAQLHNLDTLRKHIVKLHGVSEDDSFVCRWASCHAMGDSSGKGKGPAMSRPEFASIAEWLKHIEVAHLDSLRQSLGDGPRHGLSDAYDSEASSHAYLSDRETGVMITPRATPLPNLPEALAEDAAEQASPLAPILRRGMPRVRGVLSESQKEDEYKLQQLEAKKLSLGPLFDRSGATLATSSRRAGFYDDEDFEGDFSPDDEPVHGDGDLKKDQGGDGDDDDEDVIMED